MIALGTNRPMHINSLDCSVAMLTTDDLEEEDDTDDDRMVKAIFVDYAKLCYYMEGVLSLSLATPDSIEHQFGVCESTLRNWINNLHPASRRDNSGLIQPSHGSIPLVYRTLLYLVHK